MCVVHIHGLCERIGRTYKHYTHSNLRINTPSTYVRGFILLALKDQARSAIGLKSYIFILRYSMIEFVRLYTFFENGVIL